MTQRPETDRIKTFRHVLCVYPYRRDLGRMSFFPPLGLEYIAATVEPYAQALDIVDMRQETGRTKDFLRSETDLVCFSVNWDRDTEFLREEIRSVGSGGSDGRDLPRSATRDGCRSELS